MSIEKTVNGHLKSRTSRFGLAILILAFVQANFSLVGQYLGDYRDLVLFVIGIAIIALRHITTKPVSEK